MKPIVSTAVMLNADRATVAGGISESELICRAGRAIFEAISWKEPVFVAAGVGNNGGDGLALALCLAEAGLSCRLFLMPGRRAAHLEALLARCRSVGIPTEEITESVDFSGARTVADCLFGTGFHGPAEGLAASAIHAVNRSGAFVVAADIPSGLSGDTGLGEPAVRADVTVAMESLKWGHALNRARDLCGRVLVRSVGIGMPAGREWLTEGADFGSVLTDRPHAGHKGTYGTAAILGGCLNYTGAVKLANLSASSLRAGCGLARLCVPACIRDAVAPWLLESTLCALPDRDGFALFDPESLAGAIRGAKAVAVGMGWGRGPDYPAILRWLISHAGVPLIIDADGLNVLAEMGPEVLRNAAGPVILTPHPMEFQRLSGIPAAEAAAHPVEAVRAFLSRGYGSPFGLTVLLKGTCTVISGGDEAYLSNRGSGGMATAGSGDVLSGVLAGLLAWSRAPIPLTVAAGAYLCGIAGELAEGDSNPISMTAGDTAHHVGDAVTAVQREIRESEPKA